MRVGEVPSQELVAEGRRLNSGFFLTEDEQAFRVLRNWSGTANSLKSLAQSEGIYTGGIFRKLPASGPDHGVAYVSARDITRSDVRPNGYLSRRHGNLLNLLALREGMILVTCSGMNLGESIWVRRDMQGLAGSGDLIRIEADAQKVPPGYLFAFLKSRYGHVSLRKLIYGGHIRHISPKEVGDISIPRLSRGLETEADKLIQKAADLRAKASVILRNACSDVLSHLNVCDSVAGQSLGSMGHAVSHSVLMNEMRLEAYFYNQAAIALDRWAKNHSKGYWLLGDAADVFDVPPFKHVYVQPDRGVPFFTSGELFNLDRAPEKYLSRSQTYGLQKYVIREGWVLLARSGQLGGILGRPLYASSDLDQSCVSDHVIRVVAKSDIPSGYLYAYLATEELGYVLLTRTMAGASVPALWPTHLKRVPVIKCEPLFMAAIHKRVVSAFEMRVDAMEREAAARLIVERAMEGLQ